MVFQTTRSLGFVCLCLLGGAELKCGDVAYRDVGGEIAVFVCTRVHICAHVCMHVCARWTHGGTVSIPHALGVFSRDNDGPSDCL